MLPLESDSAATAVKQRWMWAEKVLPEPTFSAKITEEFAVNVASPGLSLIPNGGTVPASLQKPSKKASRLR